jgi:hypothetical protein
MSRTIWTPDRLEWMRDTGLPKSKTLEGALQAAGAHFGIEAPSIRPFCRGFNRAFGTTPGGFLDTHVANADDPASLRRQIRRLQDELRSTAEEAVTAQEMRSILRRAAAHAPDPPKWLTSSSRSSHSFEHGAPTLFLSDIHYGETVNAAEVNGVNRYNSQIAADRIERTFHKVTHLFSETLSNAKYPGIVLALGGDLLSGTIHEEIRESNDQKTFPALLRLADLLQAGINLLREAFGRVFVPCVVGNHGRLDRKPRAKGAVVDNFEYLLYHLLASRFDSNKRVAFHVSNSLTYTYRVHNTRYMLTHGDQFRGGTGITGPLTPWTLGDHRLRKQAASMAAWRGTTEHDVLLFGHWHTLFFAPTFIANGTIKGFDEYGLKKGFSYEPARQAAWLTHPDYGVTLQMKVHADRAKRGKKTKWVEVPEVPGG